VRSNVGGKHTCRSNEPARAERRHVFLAALDAATVRVEVLILRFRVVEIISSSPLKRALRDEVGKPAAEMYRATNCSTSRVNAAGSMHDTADIEAVTDVC
jgi:hypothetical protein